MGNYMTYGPVPVTASAPIQSIKKMTYETNKIHTATPKNYNIQNKMRQADRYNRNGSYRGNGIRSS